MIPKRSHRQGNLGPDSALRVQIALRKVRVITKDFFAKEDALHFGKMVERDRGIEVMREMIMDVQWRDDPFFQQRRLDAAAFVEFMLRFHGHVLGHHTHSDNGNQRGAIGHEPEHEEPEPQIESPKDRHGRGAEGEGAQAIGQVKIELSLIKEVAWRRKEHHGGGHLMSGEANEVTGENAKGGDVVLGPGPILAGLEVTQIRVLRGIGELVMLKVVLPVEIRGEKNRVGAEHVGGKVVPCSVPRQPMVGALMHEDEKRVLAGGNDDDDEDVEHPADEAEAGWEAAPQSDGRRDDDPLDGDGGNCAPLGNLGETPNVDQHPGVGAKPFGVRRGWPGTGLNRVSGKAHCSKA